MGEWRNQMSDPGHVESYEDLRGWKQGVDLVEAIYEATRNFPSEDRCGRVSQLRRAAVSVTSSIAEGWVEAKDATLSAL